MKKIFSKKRQEGAQSAIELSLLMIVVIGALIAGQVYFKRAIQGRWKSSADQLSDELYDPRFTDSNVVYGTQVNAKVNISTLKDSSGYWTMRQDESNVLSTKSGQTLIGGY